MKKTALLIVLCLITAFSISAQSNEQITIKKNRYYHNDEQLNRRDLKTLLKSEPESALLLKQSNSVLTLGIITNVALSVGIVVATGYPLGIIGGFAAALPFSVVSVNKFNKAIEVYNSKHGGGNP